jgi:hypothetical protein
MAAATESLDLPGSIARWSLGAGSHAHGRDGSPAGHLGLVAAAYKAI